MAGGKVATIVAFFGAVRIVISDHPDDFDLQNIPEGSVEATEAAAMEGKGRSERSRRCFK